MLCANVLYLALARRIYTGKTYKRIEINKSRYKWHQLDNFVMEAKLLSP